MRDGDRMTRRECWNDLSAGRVIKRGIVEVGGCGG